MSSQENEGLGQALAKTLVVLTGPTSGLGLSLYDLLQQHNTPLVAIGREIERLAASQPAQGTSVFVEADFASTEDLQWLADSVAAFEELLNLHPDRIAILINNAGTIEPIQPATDLEPKALQQAMQVNCTSPVALASSLSRSALKSNRRLKIVNITTGAAKRPIAGWLAYCASKAACRMALDTLALEADIELVHCDPGVIDTQMQAIIRQVNAVSNHGVPAVPAPSLKTPAEAARSVMSQALEGRA
jgi:benzil reductase ((S)-benzoin forming)